MNGSSFSSEMGRKPHSRSSMNQHTYPHNGQCHLSDSKPPLNIPLLLNTTNNCCRPPLPSHTWPNMQQLSQKGKRASQTPPRRGERAQGPADQQGDVPPAVYAENNSHSRMQCCRTSLASIAAEWGMGSRGGRGGWDGGRRWGSHLFSQLALRQWSGRVEVAGWNS